MKKTKFRIVIDGTVIALFFLAQLALAGGVVYVAIHFIRKFW